jgi:cytochrome b
VAAFSSGIVLSIYMLRVWDLPTRLFHWLLALAVLGLLVTAQLGGSWMNWHFRFGYVVLSLLLFRLGWGFAGGHWSRFSQFCYAPRHSLAYLRGTSPLAHRVGHNPLGAWSVFALLLALLAQVATGLFSDDEIAFYGPLTRLVSGDTVVLATWYHKAVGKWLVLALVVLHVLAILAYKLFKGEGLTRPMITGDTMVDEHLPSSRDSASSRLLALLVWSGCALAVYGLVTWGFQA